MSADGSSRHPESKMLPVIVSLSRSPLVSDLNLSSEASAVVTLPLVVIPAFRTQRVDNG